MDTKTYWKNFKAQHPEVETDQYDTTVMGFEGDTEVNDDLANLIKTGVKTATASAYDLYAISGEHMPEVGEYSIILDGRNQPVCIIKDVVVETIPLMEVSAEHAYHEGEEERTLEQWRRDHIDFFKKEYAEYNQPFNDNIPILCEVFEVVYK